jgi:hypothetical protein
LKRFEFQPDVRAGGAAQPRRRAQRRSQNPPFDALRRGREVEDQG